MFGEEITLNCAIFLAFALLAVSLSQAECLARENAGTRLPDATCRGTVREDGAKYYTCLAIYGI